MMERIEQRVLGALSLIDRVTRTPLTRPMQLSAQNAALTRNASGYYVVTAAKGLARHIIAFQQPPATPALGARSYLFTVEDPQQRYLPRTLTLRLPRDPDPANAANADSLFRPVEVAMYPAATAQVACNWSTIRATVTRGTNPRTAHPQRGALLAVIDEASGAKLASGISDERGEALVIVPGVPVTKFADEGDGGGGDAPPVVVNTLPVRLEVSLAPGAGWPVNPDALEANHETNRRLSLPLTLSTGRMEKVTINL